MEGQSLLLIIGKLFLGVIFNLNICMAKVNPLGEMKYIPMELYGYFEICLEYRQNQKSMQTLQHTAH